MENNPTHYQDYTIKNFLISFSIIMAFVILNLVGCLFLIGIFRTVQSVLFNQNINITSSSSSQNVNSGDISIKRFQNESEYLKYLSNFTTNTSGDMYYGSSKSGVMESSKGSSQNVPTNSLPANRYSTTNVQTLGVDEPDVLKSDGTYFYFSKVGFQYYYDYGNVKMMSPQLAPQTDSIIMPQYNDTSTISYNLLPVNQIEKIQELKEGGTLMLYKNVLVINSNNNKLTAYDVSNPQKYNKIWEITYDTREYISQMRSIGDDLFVITNSNLSISDKCIMPLYTLEQSVSNEIKSLDIRCTDLYYPISNNTNNSRVTVNKLSITRGESKGNVSFLAGNNYSNILYMSSNNIYLAYQKELDNYQILSGFIFNENSIPVYIKNKISYLNSLDISNESKISELSLLIRNYQNSLNSNDLLTFTNEMQNSFNDYAKLKARDWIKSDIVKISLDLRIEATGTVNGNLLNQFAMDEYDNHLRVATTIEPNIYIQNYYYSGTAASESGVHVFDKNMREVGQVGDIGQGEKIFGVRFSKKHGYVVTFRQTDPFYVLDLSNVKLPKVVGELKIPGYSSYLHEIEEDMVLGVGMEGNSLKLSLFDISDKTNPKETSKYLLAEYGSEILQDYHAFLVDKEKKVFFIPGYNGGYIFNYKNGDLKLEKSIAGSGIKRAMIVNDYMYLFSDKKLVVVDNSYDVVDEVSL